MKRFIFLVFVFIPIIISAQTVDFSIEGVISKPGKAKFAYLHIRDDRLEKAEIKEGRFKIEGKADLQENFYRAGILFLDERGDIDFEEVTSKLKEHVWVAGREQFLKTVALENIQMEIEEPVKIAAAKINEGLLTMQMAESSIATRKGFIKDFIKKYPDSPVSFHSIKGMVPFYELSVGKSQDLWGSISEMFDVLSDRLKNSEQGVAVKKKIDQLENGGP